MGTRQNVLNLFFFLPDISSSFPVIQHLPLLDQNSQHTKHHFSQYHIVMATVQASKDAMATVADKAPITSQRKVPEDLDTKLPKPCNLFFLIQFLLIYFFAFKNLYALWVWSHLVVIWLGSTIITGNTFNIWLIWY